MYRYIALIWDPANTAAGATAEHLRQRCTALQDCTQVLDEDGLVLIHSGAEPGSGSCETRVLQDGAGAICGRLFRRGHELQSHARCAPMGFDESAEITSTGCRALLEDYWGRYVAIVRDDAAREVHVLRDPSGTLPCFVTRLEDVHVVFSDIETCLRLDLFAFSINWNFIAAFVPYSALQIRDTGLNEVSEVQPGEHLLFRAGDIDRQLLWNPVNAVDRGLIEDPVEAAAAVRAMVRTCVHAWASLHDSIIHNLSGGLDSSIVLSCLADAPNCPSVAALHYFAPASREDERKFARITASHLGTELIECPLDPEALELRQLLHIRRAPRPWFYLYDFEHGPLETGVASSRGATGVFSGASGDGLFMQPRAEFAVAEYLYHRGFSSQVLRVALNAAVINRTSMWPILRQGIRQHFKRPTHSEYVGMDEVRAVIPRAVLEAARNDDSLFHPWIAAAGDIPPGLRWHILCLSVPPIFYDSFANGVEVERTLVLFSQPLIEICLRIPMYVWISGGRDRSVARQAFAADLPPAIIRRTAKGVSHRHNRRLIDANAAFLREMLLDGLLVKNGLLDRAAVDAVIAQRGSPAGFEYNEVLRQHLCTEVWLRRWSAPTTSFAG